MHSQGSSLFLFFFLLPMKKVRFLWFGALLVLAGMLFAGCEKAQEEKISINTKDAIKLDLFQSQEE